MAKKKPTGVVIGDPAGIGPEITVKALSDPALYRASQPILIGDSAVVERALQIANVRMEIRPLGSLAEARLDYPVLNVFDLHFSELKDLPMGRLSPASGRAFVHWFRKAYELAQEGGLGAIAYAPLNKEAVHAAGYPYHDEIDMLKDFSGDPDLFLLALSTAGRFRTASVPPLHISLRQACDQLSMEAVLHSLLLLREGLGRLGIPDPVIGVAALNPHGGESGLHGDEEARLILPAIQRAREKGIDARGPFPPDTVFFRAKGGEFDCVLGMYHDQTRIAMKMVDFRKIIYSTLGTSSHFVSPAHGTAFDIAGKGIADANNFKLALKYAAKVR